MAAPDQDIIAALTAVLEARRSADPADSYVASLYASGLNKILEKVGEEAVEVILAAKDLAASAEPENRQALLGEAADLWFHCLVMLAHLGVDPQEVLDVLAGRFGLSGHAEKASR